MGQALEQAQRGLRWRPSAAIVILLLLISAAVGYQSAPSAWPEATLIGRASVIDGDTIEISGERVRINGVDAPESAQTCETGNGTTYRCGARSATALADYLGRSSPARCTPIGRDRYGRIVGSCQRADGQDVAEWLVRRGHALDWPRYSKGAYASHQDVARRARHGIWSGSFQLPWEWRAQHRMTMRR